MTIQSVTNLLHDSNKLLDAICNEWQEKEITTFSTKLIAIRNTIEDIKDNSITTLIRDCEAYKTFGECQKKTFSAQSKLVKKSLKFIDSPKEFYKLIEVMWKQIRGENSPIGLGERLAKTDRKNPIVLCALDEYARTILFKTDLKSPSYTGFRKHFTNLISPTIYNLFERTFPDFYENIFNEYLANYNIKKEDQNNATHHFLIQNLSHPLIRLALLEKSALNWLNYLLKKGPFTPWDKYQYLPSKIYQELEKKFNEVSLSTSFKICSEQYEVHPELVKAIESMIKDFSQQIEELKKETITAPPQFYDKSFFATYKICNKEHLQNKVLVSNLELGLETLRHAIERLPYSSNYFLRENLRFSTHEMPNIDKSLRSCRGVYQETVRKLFPNKKIAENGFLYRQYENKVSKNCLVGNCFELSSVAFIYLLKQKLPHLNIEMISIEERYQEGNHGFIMIGRKGDIEKPETWENEAVLIDAWRRQVFPAILFKDLLKNCKLTAPINGMPSLENFNPALHKLSIVTQHVMTSNLYKDRYLTSSKVSEIRALLDDFHDSQETSQKIVISQEILKQLPRQYNLDTKETLTLFTQLNYFLKLYPK